jgi:hypothetical protein
MLIGLEELHCFEPPLVSRRLTARSILLLSEGPRQRAFVFI